MTLINYLNRIHFGDGVLEDALWSELERNGKRRPLVIASANFLRGDWSERFFTGIPARTKLEVVADIPDVPTEEAAKNLADLYRDRKRDHLISFGDGNAIDLAKVVRILVKHDKPLSFFASSEGGSYRIGDDLPDLYAIPGILGFASAISAQAPVVLKSNERADVESKNLIPTVTICDPTLTLGSAPEATASAGVSAIARCIEAFLSRSYNPPADGIALDGLERAVGSLYKATQDDDLEARREMMAASLNGALAQEKGLGIDYAIGKALDAVAQKNLDSGALSRLTLPAVMRFYAEAAERRYVKLQRVFGLPHYLPLADGLETFLRELPLPRHLTELGVDEEQIAAAAPLAAEDRALTNSPRIAHVEDILSIMHSVQ